MSDNVRSIHLLLERLGGSIQTDHPVPPGTTPEASSPERLEIREGVNYLSVSSRRLPSLKWRTRGAAHDLILFQPIWHYPSPKLLMLIPGSMKVNVNGTPAPPVSLLDEKDEVSFDRFNRCMVHVTLFHSPQVGPPQENEIGTKCPVCRVKFTRETTVYRCHNCSNPLHVEDDKKIPENKRLECARICSVCPTCQVEIQMNSGYRYLPEFCSK